MSHDKPPTVQNNVVDEKAQLLVLPNEDGEWTAILKNRYGEDYHPQHYIRLGIGMTTQHPL